MFQGSMVALVTPMADDGAVDYLALQALVEWHVEAGTDAIVAVGTTGESATLDEQEHCDVIRHVVKYANGRITVIAGTGANSTTEAINLSRCAQDSGADACLLVTPYYNKPTQEGLYLHHKKIAEKISIPQILYNVPGRTACDMLPETVGRLAEIGNIIGIKEATGDLARVEQIRAVTNEDFALFSGDDETGNAFMLKGGDGVISVTANIAPESMAAMCKAALAGNVHESHKIDMTLQGLHKNLFVESNPIPVKYALYRMGKIPAGIRLPMTPLDKRFHAVVDESMQQAGVSF